jgi:NAD(P)-dependent dehydrogenase (short-subunit alcohol dehydrogenase family)
MTTTTTPQRPIGSGFGARSTAADVLEGIDLTGRLALMTGGYSGIGLEATRALTAAGAHVVVPARRPEAAREALAGIDGVEVDTLDLADQDSIAGFAERFLASGRDIHLTINSAAVMASPHSTVGPGAAASAGTTWTSPATATTSGSPTRRRRRRTRCSRAGWTRWPRKSACAPSPCTPAASSRRCNDT